MPRMRNSRLNCDVGRTLSYFGMYVVEQTTRIKAMCGAPTIFRTPNHTVATPWTILRKFCNLAAHTRMQQITKSGNHLSYSCKWSGEQTMKISWICQGLHEFKFHFEAPNGHPSIYLLWIMISLWHRIIGCSWFWCDWVWGIWSHWKLVAVPLAPSKYRYRWCKQRPSVATHVFKF